jgi:hypothetical protein
VDEACLKRLNPSSLRPASTIVPVGSDPELQWTRSGTESSELVPQDPHHHISPSLLVLAFGRIYMGEWSQKTFPAALKLVREIWLKFFLKGDNIILALSAVLWLCAMPCVRLSIYCRVIVLDVLSRVCTTSIDVLYLSKLVNTCFYSGKVHLICSGGDNVEETARLATLSRLEIPIFVVRNSNGSTSLSWRKLVSSGRIGLVWSGVFAPGMGVETTHHSAKYCDLWCCRAHTCGPKPPT